MADALKVNTSVQEIDLRCEWCGWRLPSVHACVAAVRLTKCMCVCVYLYACVVYVSESHRRCRSHSCGGGTEGEHQCAEDRPFQ